jgi:branched-chain amino acid transport system ATP-binding protein
MLTVDQLSGGYGRSEVLREVSLRIRPGEIVTILGANGAGKSTLLNALVGLLPQMMGRITFLGEAIDGLKTERIVRRGISLVPERRQLFGLMTVAENLAVGAFASASKTDRNRRLAEQYVRFPILNERRRQPAQTLSGGQQQMLAIARALMSRPKLLLLDEPSLGLAPIVVQQMFEEIKKIRAAGSTVLLVEQNAIAALRIADRAYIMQSGTIVDEQEAPRLLTEKNIAQAYLGDGDADSMERRIRHKAVSLARQTAATHSFD